MSRFGDLQSSFIFLFKEMKKYPFGTLGWILAAQEFNSQIDFMCEYTNFEFEDFKLNSHIPHNLYFIARETSDMFLRRNGPKIIIPRYDLNQVLKDEYKN